MDRFLRLESSEGLMNISENPLAAFEQMEGAIVRLVLEYPKEIEAAVDGVSLRNYLSNTFSLNIEKHAQVDKASVFQVSRRPAA